MEGLTNLNVIQRNREAQNGMVKPRTAWVDPSLAASGRK